MRSDGFTVFFVCVFVGFFWLAFCCSWDVIHFVVPENACKALKLKCNVHIELHDASVIDSMNFHSEKPFVPSSPGLRCVMLSISDTFLGFPIRNFPFHSPLLE